MEKEDVQKLWDDAYIKTLDRSKGSFKRAIWYGNKNAFIGQNKGLRKMIRNAPRTISTGALSLIPIPVGLSAIFDKMVDIALDKGKEEIYQPYIKNKFKKPLNAEEKYRKNIKKTVKDLKSDAFKVIDRNLVKLKDAKDKISPSIKDLMGSAPQIDHISSTEIEKQKDKAFKSVRNISETFYYIQKERTLIAALQNSLEKIDKELEKLEDAVNVTKQDTLSYIEIAIP